MISSYFFMYFVLRIFSQKSILSTDDTVSMIPKGPLKEYILEDEGYLFNGYWKWPNAKPWAFGQVRLRVILLTQRLYINV